MGLAYGGHGVGNQQQSLSTSSVSAASEAERELTWFKAPEKLKHHLLNNNYYPPHFKVCLPQRRCVKPAHVQFHGLGYKWEFSGSSGASMGQNTAASRPDALVNVRVHGGVSTNCSPHPKL